MPPTHKEHHVEPPKKTKSPNPLASFDTSDLPPELVHGLNIREEIFRPENLDVKDVFNRWIGARYPSLAQQQDCKDVLTGKPEDTASTREIHLGGKLAMIAYAMPYYMGDISSHFHMKNTAFSGYMNGILAESSYLASENMDSIVSGRATMVHLPAFNQLAGYYVRTKIQVYDKSKKNVTRIPDWKSREKLLDVLVSGNVNCYVLRKNLADGKYECYITFRGTSSEFNGIPQYGRKLKNTQVYRMPQYDPIQNKFVKGGSDHIPLFYYYYVDQVENVKPHLYQCLRWLGAFEEDCTRIVVAGHSMGGALTVTFNYILRHDYPELWDKTFFRAFASPMCCNTAAILKMEQWVIDSRQRNKYIEVINTDDFVNIQYLLGSKDGLRHSIKQGLSAFATWIMTNYSDLNRDLKTADARSKHVVASDESFVDRVVRIVQLYPEIAFSIFLNGSFKAQITETPASERTSARMGQRPDEIALWGTPALRNVYDETMRLYFCERRVRWLNEHIGKSHLRYANLNIGLFGGSVRVYENNMYRTYAHTGLDKNNETRIVPIFPEVDESYAMELLSKHVVKQRPSPLLRNIKAIIKSNQLATEPKKVARRK